MIARCGRPRPKKGDERVGEHGDAVLNRRRSSCAMDDGRSPSAQAAKEKGRALSRATSKDGAIAPRAPGRFYQTTAFRDFWYRSRPTARQHAKSSSRAGLIDEAALLVGSHRRRSRSRRRRGWHRNGTRAATVSAGATAEADRPSNVRDRLPRRWVQTFSFTFG